MSKFTVSSETLRHFLLLLLLLLQEKEKHVSQYAKQHQLHKQATYLNESDNYLNIFPLLLQLAPISEAALNSALVYVPEAINSLRLTYEYGGGWLVWVEAIDSMYLRRCQPCRIQTHSDGSYKECTGGYLCLNTYTYPRAPASHVINQSICLPVQLDFESKAAYEEGDMNN